MAVYTDNFTYTDGELHAKNSTWVDAGDGNAINVSSNAIVLSTGSAFHAYYYNQTFNSKHYAKLKFTGTNARYFGPAIRVASGTNYFYCFGCSDAVSNTYPGECIAGSATDWTGQVTIASGVVLEMWVDATTEGTIIYKNDGVTVETYTGKTGLSGGRPGVAGYLIAAVTGDDWEGGDVGGAAAGVINKVIMKNQSIVRSNFW